MTTISFFLPVLFCSLLTQGQTPSLFKIVQDDRVGYINEKGRIVIQSTYINGNDFSEGLAAVRQNGRYGFIDETGNYVIKPDYDIATNFVKGIVVVYKDGQPLFINKKGEIILPAVYKALTFLDDRKGIITTKTNRQGVIDIPTKRLLIDTIFGSIGEFKNGVAIVNEYVPPGKKQKKDRVAVIDQNGKFVVPFGRYEAIKPYVNGYAVVEIDDPGNKDGSADGLIDVKGKLLFKRLNEHNSYIDGNFYDGYAKVNLYKYWIPEKEGVISTSEKNYEGFINTNGEAVFNDTNYRYVKEFSNGRTFVKKEHSSYELMDRKFKRIGNDSYLDILNDGFRNGYAIVETAGGYGIIDTTGNFVVSPRYDEIDAAGIVDGYFFFATGDDDNKRYGISDMSGNEITKPIMNEFDRSGFVNGLLRAVINGKLSYINKKGEIVWQQPERQSTGLTPLNIDFMNRGYFYAYSSPKNTEADLSGGWYSSSNKPQRIPEKQFPGHILAVTIDTTKVDTFQRRYPGYKLFISNRSPDTVTFNAQDSRLYMKLQALDKNGVWKDIEYLPSSWCGNSYHTIELEPDSFWEFTIPNYEGEIPVKIRAELKYVDKADRKKVNIIYSNIIRGSINPGQFWNKRPYYPNGLMDPYND